MSKRSFLKLGLGGTAALFMAPLLRPRSLFAAPVSLPPGYLESRVHAYWMKLSYNDRGESRQTRRKVGAALRHVGSLPGPDGRERFAAIFDQAVEQAFLRFRETGRKPETLLGLVQWLYDEFIHPEHGPAAGMVWFLTLLSMSRGVDGTDEGEMLHKVYGDYRAAALWQKNAYLETEDPELREKARLVRVRRRAAWQDGLVKRARLLAWRETTLSMDFLMEGDLLAGWDLVEVPHRLVAPRLSIQRMGGDVVVSWKGEARLQVAPTVRGPWKDLPMTSPARLPADGGKQFFRTVQPQLEQVR